MDLKTVGLYGLGVILLVAGFTFWKLGMARKLTPWVLLAAACTLMGTAVYQFLGRQLTTLVTWGSKITVRWFSVGVGVILLGLAVWITIYLWNGLKPKGGKFRKGHNWAALFAPVIYSAAGGAFASATQFAQQLLQESGLSGLLH